MRTTHVRTTVVTATLAFLSVSACKPKDTTASAADTAATHPAAVAVAPASPNVVTIHAKDFAFENAPATIAAGMTTFELVNDGHALHHLVIVRLDSGKTLADFQKELAKPAVPPKWATFMGGPNAPDPGKTSNATLDLTPGSYAMLCMVDIPGGVPHFAKGMIQPFTVTAATGPTAAAPASDVAIKLTDYAFGLSAPVAAGHHTFAVSNAASQMHEVELVRFAPGKTMDDLLKWISKPNGPPPAEALGGVGPFTNTTDYFSADMTPGTYGLICFVPDANDGKPHFMHGMTKTFTVS